MSCSVQHGAHPSCALEPLGSSISPARLLPLHSVSERSPAGLSRLQRCLRHEDKVPSRAAERKRSRSRFLSPTHDTLTLSQGGRMSSQGGSLHHSQQCSAPSTRSCALYLGFITVRRACLKLVAKTRRQLRKGSATGDVTCSTELTRHVRWSNSETDSPLLVCSRFIRYQSGLPLVPRGCSAAYSA